MVRVEIISESQHHRKTLCSVIYVCLSIIHSRLQMTNPAELCVSTSLIFPVPNFAVLSLSIARQIGLGCLHHRAVSNQCSKYLWDASVATSGTVAGRPISAKPRKMDSLADYWTGKWMYRLHRPQTGNSTPYRCIPQYSWCTHTLHPETSRLMWCHIWSLIVWNIVLLYCFMMLSGALFLSHLH